MTTVTMNAGIADRRTDESMISGPESVTPSSLYRVPAPQKILHPVLMSSAAERNEEKSTSRNPHIHSESLVSSEGAKKDSYRPLAAAASSNFNECRRPSEVN